MHGRSVQKIMRQRALQKLMDNQPVPLTWALLNLPSRRQREGWQIVETVFNGAFYEHDTGMQARCRGLEPQEGVRWWHVVAGTLDGKPLTFEQITQIRDTFFPDHATVALALLPMADSTREEGEGHVVHMWWAMDGQAPIPPVSAWERDVVLDSEPDAPTHEYDGGEGFVG